MEQVGLRGILLHVCRDLQIEGVQEERVGLSASTCVSWVCIAVTRTPDKNHKEEPTVSVPGDHLLPWAWWRGHSAPCSWEGGRSHRGEAPLGQPP